MTGYTDFITEYAYAVFVSDISCHTEPTDAAASAAIRHAISAFGGTHECATAAAREYGERPDTASQRMRWARSIVTALYDSVAYPASAPRGAKVRM
jgi:soluble lytic murein transglycosylase-like protein